MFETMIIMAPADICDAIIAELAGHNPGLRYVAIFSSLELQALPLEVLSKARLISFTNPVIVAPDRLAAIGYGAYNFHPGPPSHPGLAPAHFALYQGSRIFGATVHRMVDKVDAGPIVGAEFCAVGPGATVHELETRAVLLLARLFEALAPMLACSAEPIPAIPVSWSPAKSTHRKFAALCEIPLGIEPAELDLRVRAFGSNHFGLAPTVTLHGHRFRYVPETTDGKEAGASPSLVQQSHAPPSASDATRLAAQPAA